MLRGRTGAVAVDRDDQLMALTSPARQEVLDGVQAIGPCSIAELAELIGRPPDSLYYHVRKLVDVGLLVQKGSRKSKRRDEAVFDLTARPLRLVFDTRKDSNIIAMIESTSAMLRITDRNFKRSVDAGDVIIDGKSRNTWVGRLKGWLTKEEVAEVNTKIADIVQLFTRHKREPGTELHAITSVFMPLRPKDHRRPGKNGYLNGYHNGGRHDDDDDE
ncbi:MAG: helix-turn-helix transcriptional regulator [Phycisphaerales bacterium]|nr:helix-turn-helix transcriptional regulator [Phycisphaerales bacterium]